METVWTLGKAFPVTFFQLNISTICWRSKKQKSVATSTCQAEYIALERATKQWIWLTNGLEELNMPVTNAAMFCDNKAAIDIAYNQKIGDRSKISTLPIIWCVRMLNLDGFLSFRLNWLKI
jgi:hypothetical protein